MTRVFIISLYYKEITYVEGIRKIENKTKSVEEIIEETNQVIQDVESKDGEIISIVPFRTTNNPARDTTMITYKLKGKHND